MRFSLRRVQAPKILRNFGGLRKFGEIVSEKQADSQLSALKNLANDVLRNLGLSAGESGAHE
jgi:hypothetical protein